MLHTPARPSYTPPQGLVNSPSPSHFLPFTPLSIPPPPPPSLPSTSSVVIPTPPSLSELNFLNSEESTPPSPPPSLFNFPISTPELLRILTSPTNPSSLLPPIMNEEVNLWDEVFGMHWFLEENHDDGWGHCTFWNYTGLQSYRTIDCVRWWLRTLYILELYWTGLPSYRTIDCVRWWLRTLYILELYWTGLPSYRTIDCVRWWLRTLYILELLECQVIEL